MMEILLPLLSCAFFLLFSAFFSGAETGILSCSVLKLKNLASQNDKRARILETLINRKSEDIILILIGTNLANTLYSLSGETFIHAFWRTLPLKQILPTPGFLFTTCLLTPVLLIFSEIFPKSLFRYYSFSLTRQAAPVIAGLLKILRPLAQPLFWVFQKRFAQSVVVFDHENISLLAESGKVRGKLNLQQENTIRNILALSGKTVDSYVQHFRLLPKLTIEMRRDKALQILRKKEGPFFVFKKKEVVGIVTPQRVWAMNTEAKIKNAIIQIPHFPYNTSAIAVLKQLVVTQLQIGLIIRNDKVIGYISIQNLLCRNPA